MAVVEFDTMITLLFHTESSHGDLPYVCACFLVTFCSISFCSVVLPSSPLHSCQCLHFLSAPVFTFHSLSLSLSLFVFTFFPLRIQFEDVDKLFRF